MTICNVPACDRHVSYHGLCNAHVQRLSNYGDVRADDPIRPYVKRDLAPAPPRLPQRAAVDAYCTECGRTGSHWAGCPGGDAA